VRKETHYLKMVLFLHDIVRLSADHMELIARRHKSPCPETVPYIPASLSYTTAGCSIAVEISDPDAAPGRATAVICAVRIAVVLLLVHIAVAGWMSSGRRQSAARDGRH
jgi:hypothetical protein